MRRKLQIAGLAIALLAVHGTLLGQAPVGEIYAADPSMQGTVLYAGSGTTVMSGSQVVAGARAAVMKLTRGGEIKICPNTSVSVTSSPNGRTLMFSVNEGEVEFHFDTVMEGDALQTPDFRLQFAGPGRFDTAICTDKNGGLAVRGSTNSRAAIVVSEMMGDGVFQVPAGASMDFKAGSVRDATPGVVPCGCPEPPPTSTPPVILSEQVTKPPVPEPPPATTPEVAPTETHVQVDAPFIYRGDDIHPEIVHTVAKMQAVADLSLGSKLQGIITPPAEPVQAPVTEAAPPKPLPQKKSGGFFKKLGSFFGKMFGR